MEFCVDHARLAPAARQIGRAAGKLDPHLAQHPVIFFPREDGGADEPDRLVFKRAAAADGDALGRKAGLGVEAERSEEHTSELQSLMRISYAVFCLKTKSYEQEYDTYHLNNNTHTFNYIK